MDAITDLTEQAVSFLSVIRDTCRIEKEEGIHKGNLTALSQMDDIIGFLKEHKLGDACEEKLKTRVAEIVWSSAGKKMTISIKESFLNQAWELLYWFRKQQELLDKDSVEKKGSYLSIDTTPNEWRKIIRFIFYQSPNERLSVANAIRYMPVQVLWCFCDEKPDLYDQRLYQFWLPRNKENGAIAGGTPELDLNLLKKGDKKHNQAWWIEIYDINKHPLFSKRKKETNEKDVDEKPITPEPRFELAKKLLVNDAERLAALIRTETQLPFETIYNEELNDINISRKRRLPTKDPADNKTLPSDPLEKAWEMELYGVAFSGGGIRSATFNLGILQKLAEDGALSKIDYLSTVSGGGYIGSWLLSWIKRSGDLKKVKERLDPTESSDPMAEEVRPIRWLRMFSNYLAPDASIMSADSWTIGITWLRNTIINQLILLLLLCTLLSCIDLIFAIWQWALTWVNSFSFWSILIWSAVIILPASVFAGMGMFIYTEDSPPQSKWNLGKSRYLPVILIGWIAVASFAISACFYSLCTVGNYPMDFMAKFWRLSPAAGVGVIGLLLIATLGKYHKSDAPDLKWGKNKAQNSKEDDKLEQVKTFFKKMWSYAPIVSFVLFSSIIAAGSCWALLTGTWQYVDQIPRLKLWYNIPDFTDKLVFILGLPVMFEIISCCVIVRMMLMGDKFPDERREWWGRMGALVHRFSLLWILITFSSLLLRESIVNTIAYAQAHKYLPVALGSWLALVGKAVQMAYNSSSKPADKQKSGFSIAELFIRIAPYIFMVGFILLGVYTMQRLHHFSLDKAWHIKDPIDCLFRTIIVMALITLAISWRTGVNEFSLHHFYRNRLVRAYLGATRRRTERQNTANNFTGFDKCDDLKLKEFTVAENYYGPYPILNTTLNATIVSELDRQDRKGESFIFTPKYCGFDFSPTRSAAYTTNQVYEYGYRQTKEYAYDNDGPTLGTAMAISGAAANPNMGYHSSAATAFLLTIFNVRLGWWIGNPRLEKWKRSNPRAGIVYLIKDLIGKSDINSDYVCLSDGGHFDNMGLYELIRRKCKHIILGDGEEDPTAACEGLANAIRRCRIDFGVEIDIKPLNITIKDDKTSFSKAHIAEGTIKYADGNEGTLIYIKTSVTGSESTDIRQYYMTNPGFPQQPTSDQFFDESQFESYRRLGYSSVDKDILSKNWL